MHNSLLNRLGSYETALRETGVILPPPPSPIPMHIPQSSPLPMPTSPFAPSPVPGRSASMGGFIPYPSPGMYPSPMLQPNPHYPVHPHAQSHSPTPFRRLSGLPNGFLPTPGLEDGSNGPMIPAGLTGYPMDIGSSTMPIGLGHPASLGDHSEDSEENKRRRQSIESSVLKKKVKEMSTAEGELRQPIEEEEIQSGDRIQVPATFSQSGSGSGSKSGFGSESMSEPNSSASNSHPSSPRSVASALPPLSNGGTVAISQNGVHANGHEPLISTGQILKTNGSRNGLRVISDGENGNVYYASEDERVETNGHIDPADDRNGDVGQTQGDDEIDPEAADAKSFEPIFASLAHTPEELGHIKSQAAKYRDRGRSVSSLSTTGSRGGSGDGLGSAGLASSSSLSASPHKNHVPLQA